METRRKITAGHRVGIWFPRYLMKALRVRAKAHRVSVSHLVREFTHYALHNGRDS